jgi:hypothetical protein
LVHNQSHISILGLNLGLCDENPTVRANDMARIHLLRMIILINARHVAHTEETTDAYEVLVENLMAKDCLGDLRINGMIILK